jgi:hypothetical protein
MWLWLPFPLSLFSNLLYITLALHVVRDSLFSSVLSALTFSDPQQGEVTRSISGNISVPLQKCYVILGYSRDQFSTHVLRGMGNNFYFE